HVISRAALKMIRRGASRDQILTLPAEILDVDAMPVGAPTLEAPMSSTGTGARAGARPDLELAKQEADDLYAVEPFYGPGSFAVPDPAGSYGTAHDPARILPLRDATDDFQRRVIEQALLVANYNWAHAARLLQLDSSNLHKVAKKLGLKRGKVRA